MNHPRGEVRNTPSEKLIRNYQVADTHGSLIDRIAIDVRLSRTMPERAPTETATDIPKRSMMYSNNAKISQKNHWEALE